MRHDRYIPELIDTCWNVNASHNRINIHISDELIDTCWNVNNCHTLFLFIRRKRINRYMLECKLPDTSKTALSGIGINRYMLECKFYYSVLLQDDFTELIDTCWNVNFFSLRR